MRSIHATLTALAFTAMAALSPSASFGQANPPYFTIAKPEKWTATRKIEVTEVFTYACGHCAEFQPLVTAWRKKLDTKKVEFAYIPAPYDRRDSDLARGFFAAEKLGAVEKTHQQVFDALHKNGIRIQSFADVAALYSRLGLSPVEFNQAAKAPEMEAKLRRTFELMVKYQIDSTPTLIVDGRYRITADTAGSHENMLKIVDELIKTLSTQPTSTSRQAPSKGK